METTLDIKSVEQKLVDITVTPIPMNASVNRKDYNIPPRTQISPVITTHQSGNIRVPSTSTGKLNNFAKKKKHLKFLTIFRSYSVKCTH